MNGQSSRRTHIDILRIIACFLVIVNHTNSHVFQNTEPSSAIWTVSVSYFFVSKTAVPLFVMISGSLLLGRNESYGKTLKRILRIAAILLGTSVFYFAASFDRFSDITLTEVAAFLRNLYTDAASNSFWYLYLYIGLLLLLPFLRRMVQSFTVADYRWFIALAFFFSSLFPTVMAYLELPMYNQWIITPLFNSYLLYFILGYYIEHIYEKRSAGLAAAAIGLFVFFIAFSVVMTYLKTIKEGGTYLFWDSRTAFNTLIPSVCVFYLAGYLQYIRIPERLAAVFSEISACTFGIYLLSDLFIEKFNFVYHFLIQFLPAFTATILHELFLFAAGGIIVFYTRRVLHYRFIPPHN